jgi:hypothetical protein
MTVAQADNHIMANITEPAASSSIGSPRRTFSLRQVMLSFLVLSMLLAIAWYGAQYVVEARRASIATGAHAPLNQVMLALSNYHDLHGSFPPAYIADKDGKPMHSWRVLILPYLEHQTLYDQYLFDEPWNSPRNMQLADQMPRVFHSPSEPPSSKFTNVVVIVGPGTAFPGANTTKLADFTDGAGNTILATEIANSDICWLEPRDLDTSTMSFTTNDRKQPSISAARWRRPYVVFADTISAFAVPAEIKPADLEALTTIAGGESVTREQIWPQNP